MNVDVKIYLKIFLFQKSYFRKISTIQSLEKDKKNKLEVIDKLKKEIEILKFVN